MPMLPVPAPILTRFEAIIEKRAVAPIQRADYKKWLRYFLDFCAKYPVPEAKPDQVRLFISKRVTKGNKRDVYDFMRYAQLAQTDLEIFSDHNKIENLFCTPSSWQSHDAMHRVHLFLLFAITGSITGSRIKRKTWNYIIQFIFPPNSHFISTKLFDRDQIYKLNFSILLPA